MKLLREPLLHFLLAGAILFGGYSWLNQGTPTSQEQDPVRIGEGEVRWVRETFAGQWRRDPTPDELKDLLATLVNEELLAREARALGLDQQDTVVRQRLAQKLSFLVEDTTRIANPDEDQLRAFHRDHADRYGTAPRLSFRHVFFSPERRPHAAADASAALTLLASASGNERLPEGDPLPLEGAFTSIDLQALSSLFGPDFARSVFALPVGSWSGPVWSAYGPHLVLVSDRAQGEPRRYEDMRNAVLEDWRKAKERETKDAYLDKLRDKYGVVVEDSARSFMAGTLDRQAVR